MEENLYDLVIIGAGPAGLTAGVYAGRFLLKTLILGELPGGTITEAHKVCNFPSEKEIIGISLGAKMIQQVKDLGVKINQEKVEEVKKQEGKFKIKTNRGEYFSKKIILAVGREKQKLNVPGEKEFLGKGVSYCATCDAGFFKEKDVAVVGGSNAALTAALLLSEYAKKVYIIYRKDKFYKGEPSWIKQVEENEKIEKIFNDEVKEIKGDKKVESIKLNSGRDLVVDGIFVEIGYLPEKKLSGEIGFDVNSEGYIKVNKKQETSVAGIYAAGDITDNPLKQVITACGEGATAANSTYEEIKKEN
jgi:thioredoxin reductase (NADPH)